MLRRFRAWLSSDALRRASAQAGDHQRILDAKLADITQRLSLMEAGLSRLHDRSEEITAALSKPPGRVLNDWLPYSVEMYGKDARSIGEGCLRAARHYTTLGLTNDFGIYEDVVDELARNDRIQARPLSKLMASPPDGKIAVALRHDIDVDFIAALKCARLLALRGIPGSFYVLHIASYYGTFHAGMFYRHYGFAEMLQELVETGVEIGIHHDALGVFIRERVNGAMAVETEIEWMRGKGATISGGVAHNSALAHGGVENFEIFRGKSFRGRQWAAVAGAVIPLEAIDPIVIGYEYEGLFPRLREQINPEFSNNFLQGAPPDAIRDATWLELTLLDNPVYESAYETDIWLLGKDSWVLAQRQPLRRFLYPLTTEQMLRELSDLPVGTRASLNVHPEYVGAASLNE